MQNKKSVETVQGWIPVPNGELYYECKGEGEALIFIHAGFADRRDWKHQREALAEHFKTIVYDQRGAGNSTVVTTPFSPTDDLKAIIDYLKLNKVHLIGHSVGGAIAVDFALAYPERVSQLVLIAPGLNGYPWSTEYLAWAGAIWQSFEAQKMTQQALAAPFYSIAMQTPSIRSEIEIITRESFEKLLMWTTFDVNDVQWFFPEAISELKKLTMPVLAIFGDKDSKDIKQIVHLLNENLINIRTIQMEEVDHLINFEKSKELNTQIIAFLNQPK